MYLITHNVQAVRSIPSKDVPRSRVMRSEFTFSCKALARAHVMGPLGGLGGLGEGVSGGHPVSAPPPLGKSRPRLCAVFLLAAMIWREVLHIEGIADQVLGCWMSMT